LEVNIFPIFWKEAHHYILVSYGSNVIFMQDDDGDNAFHIAAETAKMIRENLDWLIVMLKNPAADIEVRTTGMSQAHSRRNCIFIKFFYYILISLKSEKLLSTNIDSFNC
jgi:hypothetical protein